jgi:hypothetical protein
LSGESRIEKVELDMLECGSFSRQATERTANKRYIMDSAALDFFKKILETPSPSGYEKPVQDVVRRYVADFSDKVTTDLQAT